MTGLSFLRRLAGRGVLLGILCALAAWLLSRPELVRGIEEWLFDGWFHWRGPRPTQAKIVLIGLDDASLDRLGKPALFLSPELAEVVTCLHEQGAAAVGLDLIVPEGLELGRDFERFLEADKLGLAVAAAGNVVLAKRLLGDGWLLPLPQWRFKALGDQAQPTDLGFVNLDGDKDQFFRRQQLFGPEGDLHFALALYAVATGLPVEWDQGLWVGGQQVPLDEGQRLRVNFVGPPGSFPLVPFHEALAGARARRPLPVDVHGAIVILGVTGQSQQDYHATPYGNRFYHRLFHDDPGLMAGSELHAHLLATLADRAYLHTLSWPLYLAGLLACGAALGYGFGRLSLEWGALLTLAHHVGWLAVSLAMFCWLHVRVEMVAMLLAGFLAYAATFGLRWRRLRRMLGVVKSEAIARALEADATPLELKGEARVVTVLFADIRSFTDFAEGHTPEQAVALLNGYFTAIVPIIEEHGGTLNQYLGDGIMVIFGAPEVRDDHALRAVRAAVAVVRRVHALRARWAELDNPTFRIGVGLHTGKVVIGTVGSPRRLDYTAIGDTVNTAARIEAENKRFGSEILLSAHTCAALPKEERLRLGVSALADPVLVKGKSRALHMFRIDVPPEGSP
jgi:adenylate cyclase